MRKQNFFKIIFGFLIGLINGFLGAGGGMVAVPALKKSGLSQKEAHENAVAVILPLTLLSAALYLYRGSVTFSDALPFIPSGLIGAVVGTFIMKKISNVWLSRIFGGFMIFSLVPTQPIDSTTEYDRDIDIEYTHETKNTSTISMFIIFIVLVLSAIWIITEIKKRRK